MGKPLGAAVVFGLVLAVGAALPVAANVCAFDPVPAATLLFPFVVFDYNDPMDGITTIIGITNMSSEAQIVNVTLWSDIGTPLLDFYIVLSGYDVQTINIRDVLYFGVLPLTGTAGDLAVSPNQDPDAWGPVSHENASWPALTPAQGTPSLAERCPPTSPAYPDYPRIPQAVLDQLHLFLARSQTALRNHDDCAGTIALLDPDDWFQARTITDPTWLYVTADVVWSCAYRQHGARGYWKTPAEGGQAQYQNVLMGDVYWVGALFAAEDRAVHLEADPDLAAVAALDDAGAPVSFYYRDSTRLHDGADLREPLPTAWAMRYIGWQSTTFHTWIRAFKTPTFDADLADLVVASDPLNPTSIIARDCLAYTYFAWDEDEQVTTTQGGDWGGSWGWSPQHNLFPIATQEVLVDQLDMAGSNGWVLFVWPPSNWAGSDQPLPDRYQTWMGLRHNAYGVLTGATTGIAAGNANCFPDQVLPHLGVDYDYVDANGYTTGRGRL